MEPVRERYAKLAPFDVNMRTTIALAAIKFFAPINYEMSCRVIGKEPDRGAIKPLCGWDFLDYLEKTNVLSKPASKFVYPLRQLLGKMATSDILLDMGQAANPMIPKCYYFLKELSELRGKGVFWLAPALGPEFIYHLSRVGILHITGKNADGESVGGTGVVFDEHHILTASHVIEDMKSVDRRQVFQGREYVVEEDAIFAHESQDVAVIRVQEELQLVGGLVFHSPTIGQDVSVLGYQQIPNTRHEPPLTMHKGAVTSESVVLFNGEHLFLYSATSRPGNSGGPVISDDGYVVGIVSKDLTRNGDNDFGSGFSPHYAGVPAHVIAQAVDDLALEARIPFERFE